MNESHSELITGVRVVDIKDTSKQFVGMRIYPLDTFSLSVDRGFMGRVSVVEYWGVKERVREGKNSSNVVGNKEYTRVYVGEIESEKGEFAKNRKVKNKRVVALMWVVTFGVGVLGFVVWSRVKRSSLFFVDNCKIKLSIQPKSEQIETN